MKIFQHPVKLSRLQKQDKGFINLGRRTRPTTDMSALPFRTDRFNILPKGIFSHRIVEEDLK